MEQAIHDLVQQKVQEVLKACGLMECKVEFTDEVAAISRVELGIVEAPHREYNAPPGPQSTSEMSNALRGSSYLGSYAQKRQHNDLKGVTTTPKKRKPVQNRNRDARPAQHASKTEQHALGTSSQTSRATSASAAADSATVPPTTGTDEGSDPGQPVHLEVEKRPARDETSGPDTGVTVSKATATTDARVEAGWETLQTR